MNPEPQVNPEEQPTITPDTSFEPATESESIEPTTISETVAEPSFATPENTGSFSVQPSEPEVASTPTVDEPVVTEPVAVSSELVTPAVVEAEAETPAANGVPPETVPEPLATTVVGEPSAIVSSPKPKKKLFVILAIVLGALLVLAGSAYAVYALWYNNPKKVVSDAFVKLINAKDMSLEASLVGESSTAKTTVALSLLANSEKTSGSFQFDFTQSDTTASLKAQMASEKDKLYIKLEDLQKSLNTLYGESLADQMQQYFGALIQKVDGKWVVVTADDVKGFGNDESSKEMTCVQDEIGKIHTDTAVRSEFAKLLNDNFFIDITDKGTSVVDGIRSNHYVLELNKDVYKQFLSKVKETSVFKAVDGCLEDTDLAKELNETTKSLDSAEATPQKQETYELWVGTWNHEITKFSFTNSNTVTSTTQQLVVRPKININPQITVPEAETTVNDIKTEIEALTQQFQAATSQYVAPASSTTYTTQYY